MDGVADVSENLLDAFLVIGVDDDSKELGDLANSHIRVALSQKKGSSRSLGSIFSKVQEQVPVKEAGQTLEPQVCKCRFKLYLWGGNCIVLVLCTN